MSDYREIKQRIFDEDKIGDLLIAMECQRVKSKTNRYEAQLPEKFSAPNIRSVQVRKSPSLGCHIYTHSISDIDIYGLVCCIVFDLKQHEITPQKKYEAKKWICNTLGYSLSHQQNITLKDAAFGEGHDPLSWLKDLKKKRNKHSNQYEIKENITYDESILNQFDAVPYFPYIEKGIEYDTQIDFQIGFDTNLERIVFPIHDENGEIVSVKGRTIYEDYQDREIGKFYHYYNYNKMLELYNWHRALSHIIERKEILIFEAEKSCWLSTQYGYPNCVAIGGSDISGFQVDKIKELGIETKIILMFDNDKEYEDIENQAVKFGRNRQVYTTWDTEDLLGEKDAPIDVNKETFEYLYRDSLTNRIVFNDKNKTT